MRSIIPALSIFTFRAASFISVVLCGQTAAPVSEAVNAQDRCSVEGYIYGPRAGEVVKRARILFRRTDQPREPAYAATSDAAGHFMIEGLEPGTWQAIVQKNGYVATAYGQKSPSQSATPVTLVKGQHMKGLTFHLVQQAVISGRVVDEDNEGLADVNVRLLQQTWNNGRKTFFGAQEATTDDRGLYRIFGVTPGRYYVMAINSARPFANEPEMMIDGKPLGSYAPVYYPNSVWQLSGASAIVVTPGAVIQGIDLSMRRVRTARVSGTVTDAPSAGDHRGAVMLMPAEGQEMAWELERNELIGESGRFSFHDVPPGSYIVRAQLPDQRSVSATIEVGESNMDDVVLTAGAQPDVSGVVRAEGFDLKTAGLGVLLQDTQSQIVVGRPDSGIAPDGTFKLSHIAPGRYSVTVFPLPEGGFVKSIAAGDTVAEDDVLDFRKGVPGEITVVVSAKGGEVTGTVRRAKATAPGATVVLVPDQRDRYSLYKSATCDQNGKFRLRGIAPAKYKLFAWEQVEWGAWTSPDFLQPFEKTGEPIEVHEGDKLQKDLNVVAAQENGR